MIVPLIAASFGLCTTALLGLFIYRQSAGDYRNATVYKKLYTPRGFLLVIYLRQHLGRTNSKRLALLLGLVYALTQFKTLQAIRRNIALLDPDKADLSHAIRNCVTQAENFIEFAELWIHSTSSVLSKLGNRTGLDQLEKARSLGKGCILVTGHLGFFELGGPVMAELGFPILTLTLPEPSEALTQWRADFRMRWGVRTAVVGDDAFSAVEITRELRNGTFVALLADRPFHSHTVPVDVPHGQIAFSTAPVLLSLLSGAPIIPVGLIVQPDGKHQIVARPMIVPRWLPEGRAYTLQKFTELVAAELIPLFVAHPEQWHHFTDLGISLSSPSSAL
ncbi:MAG: lysophospholipid acyltransferase family protein [Verrucomicrobiota bacterium]